MREIVSIHIGQAGVQMSNAIWEHLCSEHNVKANGLLKSNTDESGLDTFFSSSSSDQVIPRAVTVDLEPTVIDEIRTGKYRKLFHPTMLISGLEDASNNFARGHFTIGRQLIENTVNQVRKIVQSCDSLRGFIITSSFGGGTGSGFQTLMLEKLSIEYAKYIKLSLVVYPSPVMSMSTVESYNAMLTNFFTIDISDLCVLFDNLSSYKICNDFLGIEKPTFSNLNRIFAHILSFMTVSLRYESSLNSDLDQIVTNIVPFPRIHFPILNAAPILSEARSSHKLITTNEITRMIFHNENTMVNVNTLEGDYFCCSLQYRGNVTPREANEAICEIKKHRNINFVDWCPTGFKIGLNCHPPVTTPFSGISESNIGVCMLANTSAIKQVFTNMSKYFDLLFKKRSFIYWFVGEGMEEGEFTEARDSISYLIADYEGIHTSPVGQDKSPDMNEEHINDIVNEADINAQDNDDKNNVNDGSNVIFKEDEVTTSSKQKVRKNNNILLEEEDKYNDDENKTQQLQQHLNDLEKFNSTEIYNEKDDITREIEREHLENESQNLEEYEMGITKVFENDLTHDVHIDSGNFEDEIIDDLTFLNDNRGFPN